MLLQATTTGEAGDGLPFFPDGIGPSSGLAALIAEARDERLALRQIVQEVVCEAIREATAGGVTRARLLVPDTDTQSKWRLIAIAVSKPALGLQDCVSELGEVWESRDAEEIEAALAEHHRRMTHPGAYFEYKDHADTIARRVMGGTAGLL